MTLKPGNTDPRHGRGRCIGRGRSLGLDAHAESGGGELSPARHSARGRALSVRVQARRWSGFQFESRIKKYKKKLPIFARNF